MLIRHGTAKYQFVVVCSVVVLLFFSLNDAFAGLPFAKKNKKQNQVEAVVEKQAMLEDFTYRALLCRDKAVDGDAATVAPGSVYSLQLPDFVQLGTLHDKQDIRVFNAEGLQQPVIIRERDKENIQKIHVVRELYPLWSQNKEGGDFTLGFVLDQDSRLVPKVIEQNGVAPRNDVLRGYVIQLPENSIKVGRMEFDWVKGASDTVRFSVETSDNLQDWRTVQQTATLIRIESATSVPGQTGGHALENSQIDLGGRALGTYLRLVFSEPYSAQSIRSITVHELLKKDVTGTLTSVSPVLVEEQKNKKGTIIQPQSYEYTLSLPDGTEGVAGGKGSLFVKSIDMASPEPGMMATVYVSVRKSNEQYWRRVALFTFFAVNQNGELVKSSPLTIDYDVAQIRFEAVRDQPLPQAFPLSVQYIPKELYFLAQGKPPYTLAWQMKLLPAPVDASGLRALLGQRLAIEPLVLSDIVVAEPQQGQKDSANQDSEVDMYLLWGVLVLGAVLLGWMSFRLLRNVQKEHK